MADEESQQVEEMAEEEVSGEMETQTTADQGEPGQPKTDKQPQANTDQRPISAELWSEIVAAQQDQSDKKARHHDLLEQARIAKRQANEAEEYLNSLIRDGRTGQGNLFAQHTSGDTPPETEEVVAGTNADILPGLAPIDDSWKSASLCELDIPPAILKRLGEERDIRTLGELEAFRAKHGDFWHVLINGIGDAKRQIIEDAVVKFLAARRELSGAERAVAGETSQTGRISAPKGTSSSAASPPTQ